jgi:hypothetical protein
MSVVDNPSHIYYDVQINNFQSTTTESPRLVFSETRTTSFVPKADDYYLSVVRFQVDTYSLPSFIADIQPNQDDKDLMIHSITLEADIGGVITTTEPFYLRWSPTNVFSRIPNPPSETADKLQDTSTEYYYGNSFQYFCDLINIQLKLAHADLLTKTGSIFSTSKAPFIKWNDSTMCAEIYSEALVYDPANVNKINIYFNRPLLALFTSFKNVRYGTGATQGRFYKMVTTNYGKNVETIKGTEYIVTTQEYSTISNWSPVSSIVFTTGTLPIVPNQLSAPSVYFEGNLIQSSNNSNFGNILTDLATNEMVYKPNLIYVPSAQYRLIHLTTSQPINNIDIQCFWKDKKGVLRPFILLSGASASIKILFQKKGASS